jgi:transcriptional regulator with XRE-family HTH domain
VTTPAATPNRLRDLRLARGWSQAVTADRLNRLAWSMGHDSAVNSDMISKWERGAKGVSPRYRQLLAELYRVTIADLGLDPDATPGPDVNPDATLATMLDQAATILNQLGPAGRALRPHVLATLAEDALNRHSVLAMLDTVPAPLRADPAESTAAELEQLATRSEALHGSVAPAALLTTVAAQIRTANTTLVRDPASYDRPRLHRARARLSILAGRLAEDTANVMAARAYYAQATDDAYELADEALTATAIICMAKLALALGQRAAATAHLRSATTLRIADPAIRDLLGSLAATAA